MAESKCTLAEVEEVVDELLEKNRQLKEELDDFLFYLGVCRIDYLRYKSTGKLQLQSITEQDKRVAELTRELESLRQERDQLLHEKAELMSENNELEVDSDRLQSLYDKISDAIGE